MKGRVIRAGLVLLYDALLIGCDALLDEIDLLALLYAIMIAGAAIFALLFPKYARRLQRCPWRLVLIVPWGISCFGSALQIPHAPIMGFPWVAVCVIEFVLGHNDRNDDRHLFEGLDRTVKALVEKVEAIHVPAPRLPVPV